jgi:Xaa-Pro dipeptidase
VLWPVFVGADPTPAWQRLYDAAHDAFVGMTRAVRHGASVADAVAASAAIRAGGYTICDSLLHGFGLGLHPPYVDAEEFLEPPADGGDRFERGMAVVLQPNPVTPDQRMGIQLGALTVVGEDGAEPLHAIPPAPLIAAT